MAYGLIPPMPLKERPVPLLYEVRRFFKKRCPAFIQTESECPFHFAEDAPITLAPNSRYIAVLDAGEITTGYVIMKMEGGQAVPFGSAILSPITWEKTAVIKRGADNAERGVIIGQEDEFLLPAARKDMSLLVQNFPLCAD